MITPRVKGTGSISPRDGKFLAQLPPRLGRRSRLVDTYDEAARWLDEELARDLLGIHASSGATSGVSLRHAVTTWLEGSLLEDSTRSDYQYRIDRFIHAHPVADLDMTAVLPMHVDDMLMRAPANWTRIHLAKVLSQFFSWTESNHITAGSPYRMSRAKAIVKVTAAGLERRESSDETWTPEELVTFLGHEPDLVYRHYWAFVAATAARRGEAIGLRWSNTHIDAGWCWLEDNVTEAGSKVIIGLPKNHKRRKAYFGPTIAAMLRLRQQEQEEYRATCPTWKGDWVFDRRRGKGKGFHLGVHLAPSTVTARFNRHADQLGLRDIAGPHGLRRTWATIAEDNNVKFPVRRDSMGHSPHFKEGMTGSYVKSKPADLAACARTLDDLLFGQYADDGRPPVPDNVIDLRSRRKAS